MANFLSRFIDKSSEPSPSKGVEPETLTPEVDSEAVASQEAEASLDPQAPPPKKFQHSPLLNPLGDGSIVASRFIAVPCSGRLW
uniref:Uncharacterized protein n=1 Tax=Desertifilum tharense IPPAS B-1220 TaxID=1781255 RepID=A0ACD5GUW7_9CYAN